MGNEEESGFVELVLTSFRDSLSAHRAPSRTPGAAWWLALAELIRDIGQSFQIWLHLNSSTAPERRSPHGGDFLLRRTASKSVYAHVCGNRRNELGAELNDTNIQECLFLITAALSRSSRTTNVSPLSSIRQTAQFLDGPAGSCSRPLIRLLRRPCGSVNGSRVP
jgi:hypothetical protein